MRGPSAPMGAGAPYWVPFPRVSVLRVVAMGGYVESLSFGAWGDCVVGRVGALVCVWVVGFPGIVCVSRWCGEMPPESPEPRGSGAAWCPPYPRFARSCQGA